MAQARITKVELNEMCEDFYATFPDDRQTPGIDAMRRLIMARLGELEWMDRSQLSTALQNVEKWFGLQEKDEVEHFQRVFDYVSQKLKTALALPPWQIRL